MLKNLFTFNFKTSFRILLRIILFVLFLELILTVGGGINLMIQESFNQEIKGSYRILCLGDSVTARGGKFSYPSLLQSALNKAQSFIKFQVINKGMVGWSSTEMSNHCEGLLQKYHPNMVVIMLGLTDQQHFYTMVPVDRNVRLKFLLLDRIKVYRLVKQLWKEVLLTLSTDFKKNNATDQSFDQDTTKWPTILDATNTTKILTLSEAYRNITMYHPLTIRNYNDLIEVALNKGIKVFVMQYPLISIAPLKDIIYYQNKVEFIDNEGIFQKNVAKNGYGKYFIDQDGHFTPDGSSLLVGNLSEHILRMIRP